MTVSEISRKYKQIYNFFKINNNIPNKKSSFFRSSEEQLILKVDFCSREVERICKGLVWYMKRMLPKVRLNIIYKTRKLSNYIRTKTISNDKLQRTHCIYRFDCCCEAKYIGHTKRYLKNRIEDHKYKNSSNVKRHLSNCPQYKQQLIDAYNSDTQNSATSINQIRPKFKKTFLEDKFKIMDIERNYRLRTIKESIYIKLNNPTINEPTDLSKPLNNFI